MLRHFPCRSFLISLLIVPFTVIAEDDLKGLSEQVRSLQQSVSRLEGRVLELERKGTAGKITQPTKEEEGPADSTIRGRFLYAGTPLHTLVKTKPQVVLTNEMGFNSGTAKLSLSENGEQFEIKNLPRVTRGFREYRVDMVVANFSGRKQSCEDLEYISRHHLNIGNIAEADRSSVDIPIRRVIRLKTGEYSGINLPDSVPILTQSSNFRWDPIPEAVSYFLTIRSHTGLDLTEVYQGVTKDNSFELSRAAFPNDRSDAHYTFSVRAYDKEGRFVGETVGCSDGAYVNGFPFRLQNGAQDAEAISGVKKLEDFHLGREPQLLLERTEKFNDYTVTVLSLDEMQVAPQGVFVTDSGLWIGSDQGLVRYDSSQKIWTFYERSAGVPGDSVRVFDVLPDASVVVSVNNQTAPGYGSGSRGYRFHPTSAKWTEIPRSGFYSYLRVGDSIYTAGLGSSGVSVYDRDFQLKTTFKKENSGIIHLSIADLAYDGRNVWMSSYGTHQRESNEFQGGGVSLFDPRLNSWSTYTTKNGLAHSYCSKMDLDEKEVWLTHWQEDRGLSIFDRKKKSWRVLSAAKNGIPLGGTQIALDGEMAWIGNQRTPLIRYNRKTGEAKAYTRVGEGAMPGGVVGDIKVTPDETIVLLWGTKGQGLDRRYGGIVRFPR